MVRGGGRGGWVCRKKMGRGRRWEVRKGGGSYLNIKRVHEERLLLSSGERCLI